MQEIYYKYLKAIRLKKLQLKMENSRVASNKSAKLKGAEETILSLMDNDSIENLWENLKL